MVEICSTSSGVDVHHRLDSAHGIVTSAVRVWLDAVWVDRENGFRRARHKEMLEFFAVRRAVMYFVIPSCCMVIEPRQSSSLTWCPSVVTDNTG